MSTNTWKRTPVKFSGKANKGETQIKPADIYIGLKQDGSDAVFVGATSQKLDFSITYDTKVLKQNGMPFAKATVGAEAKASFEFKQFSPETLSIATGQGFYYTDEVSGNKRVLITAACKEDTNIYLFARTELKDGTPLSFCIPSGNMTLSGNVSFGAGNESPDFGAIPVEVEALAVDVDGIPTLALWDFDAHEPVPDTDPALPDPDPAPGGDPTPPDPDPDP